MVTNYGFPTYLLSQTTKERMRYFRNFTVAHPLLEEKTKQVVDTIKNPEGYSLFMVIGPTGVGKTTLKKKVLKIIIEELLTEMEIDRSFIPIAGMELVPPDSGKFDWKDYYKRALEELCEPMIDNKIDLEKNYSKTQQGYNCEINKDKSTSRELRRSLENAFKYRKTIAFIIDEAQHFSKIASGRKLQDQLDTIKSISNISNVIHILLGTYDLMEFVNLNGQLSRRTIDIHFPRYKYDNIEDIKVFNSVIKTFELHLPLEKESNLLQYKDFIYERSVGCVGILKNWFERCLNEALNESYKCLNYELLKKHALSLTKAEKIASETIFGEAAFEEDEEKSKRLHELLGIECSVSEDNIYTTNGSNSKSNKRRSKVGQRKPIRDEVGLLEDA